jgi:chemotaxis signal transduction protein
MIDSGGKKVVFRIADVGFSLAVDTLIEIREANDAQIDRSSADQGRGLLGMVSFREDALPLWDIRHLFGLPAASADPVLILVFGSDGAWAFPIETVVGVALSTEFRNCDLPALLQTSNRRSFTSIDVWRNEPLVCFEPDLVEQLMVQA